MFRSKSQTHRRCFIIAAAFVCLNHQIYPAFAEPVNPRPLNGTPLEKSPFPSYDKNAYNKSRMKALRSKTLWSAPSNPEQTMLQAVSDSQLQMGVDHPQTLDLTWRTAQYFLKIQKFNQAEPLLKELVATIESHPQTTQSTSILSEARKKLSEIEETRKRTSYKPSPPVVPSRAGVGRPWRSSSSPTARISPGASAQTKNVIIHSKSGVDYSDLRNKN